MELINIANLKYKYKNKNFNEEASSTFDLLEDNLILTKTQTPTEGFQGDTVEFTITIKTDNLITNAILTDDLFSVGYTFVPGSVIIDNVPQNSLNPVTGINLGTINANTTKVIKFYGTVN